MRFGSRFLRPLLGFVFFGFIYWVWHRWRTGHTFIEVKVSTKFTTQSKNAAHCTIHTCLNLRKCVTTGRDMKIFIQPLLNVVNEDGEQLNPKPSTEYFRIRRILSNSVYATSNFRNACMVFPGIDTLSLGRFNNVKTAQLLLDTAASQFPQKPNLFLFSFFGDPTVFGDAIVISPNHLRSTFRPNFDIVAPPLLISQHKFPPQGRISNTKILFAQPFGNNPNASPGFEAALRSADINSVKTLSRCLGTSYCIDGQEVSYPECLESVLFVVISEHIVGFDVVLVDALNAGAIPVIISDFIVLPFEDFIDWEKAVFTFSSTNLHFAVSKLQKIDDTVIINMREAGKLIVNEHYTWLSKMVNTAIILMENRLIVPRTSLPRSIFENDETQEVCDHFVAVVTHHYDTQETKLKWALRFLLYTSTNASSIVLATERDVKHVFDEFVVPSKPIPIRIAKTSSIATSLTSTLTSYTTEGLIFILDSDFPSSNIDETLLDKGFQIGSRFPATATILIPDNRPDCPNCPYFIHVSKIQNRVPPLIDFSRCITHSDVLTGKAPSEHSLRWISCALN